jgi:methionyl-tRNA formyltransferase
VASELRLAFLTTADPLYLPAFFDRVLDVYSGQTQAVYVVPPLYKEQTSLQAARRYYRTFGLRASASLARRVLQATLERQSVSAVCKRHNVHISEVRDVNAPAFLEELAALEPDVVVSVSCPQIFKTRLIELPRQGCLNVHGSVLPNYRGIMPSFWMLANGETQAGVSIYFVNERIDAGDLCGQRIFDIEPTETLDEFLRRSKAVAAELLIDVLRAMAEGDITRKPLDLAQGSYYSWPDERAVARFRASERRLW